jgi:ABC-type uncharacterized transport system permease subunit
VPAGAPDDPFITAAARPPPDLRGGAAQALEVSILPSTTSDAGRTRVYAWYNALADAGGAAGALLAALPAVLRSQFGLAEVRAYDTTILVYAALLVGVALLYSRLSRATEPPEER